MDSFYCGLSIQLSPTDNYIEYHIFCDDDIERVYEKNTGNNFYDNILEYIKKNFCINHSGIDYQYNKYIYIHIDKNNHKDYIKEIIKDLNNNKNIWYQYRFPKLETLINNKFRSKKFLIESFIEYQNKYGYEATKDYLDKFYFLL